MVSPPVQIYLLGRFEVVHGQHGLKSKRLVQAQGSHTASVPGVGAPLS